MRTSAARPCVAAVRGLLLAACFAWLAACDGSLLESKADAAARAALVGQWHWRYREVPSDARVEVVTARAPDGSFSEDIVLSETAGRVRTLREAGQWFVQDGVLKMRTLSIDGEPIGKNSRQAFRTYDIVAIEGDRARLRPSPENGSPGLWPRVTGVPRIDRAEMPVIEQRKIGEGRVAGMQ